jgi:hypothetical protein
MRPVRTILTVMFAAAVVLTGCAAHSTTPSPVPSPHVVDQPPMPPVYHPAPPPAPAPAPKPTPTPKVAIDRVPVLADGHYDSYIRTVDTHNQRLVVDLVQVFQGQAAIDAAIADGMPHDQAQVLYVWVRNQNPRLRTLAMASDMGLDLLPGDGIESRNHQFAKLIKDSRAISNSRPAYYFTLTVTDGVVHHIQEDKTFNVC